MTHHSNGSPTLGARVERLAGTSVRACYQCGKCSAGCPMADRMDLLPNQLIRLVQMDRPQKALASEALWLCVSCQTCTARCPQAVDCAAIMDALRQVSAAEGLAPASQRRTLLFQQAFLQNIRRNGRLAELELIGAFKTRAFVGDLNVPMLFKDALLAPKLMRRGKFHFVAQKARDRGIVDRIFQRCQAE